MQTWFGRMFVNIFSGNLTRMCNIIYLLSVEFHSFLQKYPEKYYFESADVAQQTQYLPVYFGNVCLRFLPVFDIVIHRFLELPPVAKSLESLLEHLGGLYKFHGLSALHLFSDLFTLHQFHYLLTCCWLLLSNLNINDSKAFGRVWTKMIKSEQLGDFSLYCDWMWKCFLFLYYFYLSLAITPKTHVLSSARCRTFAVDTE